ncbi:MAG TPA: hypothetical protein VMW83_10720 [Spirochaetia bacterium]|nr:hypothetical protein [Spirochaetia bacterium]
MQEVKMLAFEVYVPRRSERKARARLPVVKLSKNSIVLNKIAREKLSSNSIQLAYDQDTRTIRIKPVESGGILIKKTKIFGKGFFKQFGIEFKGAFPASYDEQENALYVPVTRQA